jgi:hypothetical protein
MRHPQDTVVTILYGILLMQIGRGRRLGFEFKSIHKMKSLGGPNISLEGPNALLTMGIVCLEPFHRSPDLYNSISK